MQFRTEIPILKNKLPISYDSKVFSVGSCFAVNMAEKLDYFKMQQVVNPFGILFHPIAIENFFGFVVDARPFVETDFFFHNERWHSFDAHSDLSDSVLVRLVENANTAIGTAREFLSESTHLIITYGTAWIYRECASDRIVANCHKVPQRQFGKELLSVDTIAESVRKTILQIRKINPEVQIIFTISPVRHIKDGFVENQWSKSHLISGLHLALQQESAKGENQLHYFPSYEIMMDELRDYRFYAEDMLHPNQTAIDYIWQRFSDSTVSKDAYAMMEKINTIQKGLAHRPFDGNSVKHKQFLARLNDSISELQLEYPQITF